MLLELFKFLAKEIHGFNVFNYITLRAVMSTITSLVISFAFGPWLIKKLNQYNIGQAVRSDGPKDHLIKTGTPTMGGGLILVSIIVSTLLWADIKNNYIWLLLIVTLGFGLIGFIDDLKKVIYKDPSGIS